MMMMMIQSNLDSIVRLASRETVLRLFGAQSELSARGGEGQVNGD